MAYSFDDVIDRRATESTKWNLYDADVLPMWVADMDFRSPEPVIRALQERMAHGVFGYARETEELPALLVERMKRRYDWEIKPEDIVFLPGVVVAFNMAAHAFVGNGNGILMQTPVYHPFFWISKFVGTVSQENQLVQDTDGSYSVDWDDFENRIDDRTRMFLLCNPHNPVGKVFTRDELERMAEICLRRNLLICSDEIHADFVYAGHRHVPIASLNPEIAQRTVTLMAPSKTFNIAGLECAFAIVQNPELRQQLRDGGHGLAYHANMIGYIAATAAYREGQPWLDALLAYLDDNRRYLTDFVNQNMPGLRTRMPDGTFLSWIDCRAAGIPGKPGEFFLDKARVGLNEGEMFGPGGQGFVRFNLGTPRSLLVEALERMKNALDALHQSE